MNTRDQQEISCGRVSKDFKNSVQFELLLCPLPQMLSKICYTHRFPCLVGAWIVWKLRRSLHCTRGMRQSRGDILKPKQRFRLSGDNKPLFLCSPPPLQPRAPRIHRNFRDPSGFIDMKKVIQRNLIVLKTSR